MESKIARQILFYEQHDKSFYIFVRNLTTSSEYKNRSAARTSISCNQINFFHHDECSTVSWQAESRLLQNKTRDLPEKASDEGWVESPTTKDGRREDGPVDDNKQMERSVQEIDL